ncbi:MAG: aquaporin [Candidatus Micrarchaeota archaeon]|nr:aquaporin [Candidatus Micrarchaeota archaeon]
MAKEPTIGQKAMVEAFGTFLLTFIGAGAVIATYALSPAYPALLIIAVANGIALALAVTVAMNISGGHINPAVTIGALFAGKISKPDAAVYIVSQLVGAFIGGAFLLALYPAAAGAAVHYGTPGLGQSTGVVNGILFEALMTFFLVFVVFATAIDRRAVKVGGFAIGLTVMLDVLVGGPFTGAAMNPARAIGPTIASMYFANWYVYWIGPILGAIVAALIYKYLILKD